jgi:hypothetical protein
VYEPDATFNSAGGADRRASIPPSDIAIMFGLWEQFSLPAGIATLPVALWEFSLGVWLVVKGFKPSSITAEMATAGTRPAYQDAV